MSRTMIAYDGTPSARRALERAVAVHQPGDEISVIGVAPVVTAGPWSPGIAPADTDAGNRHDLAEAVQFLARHGIEATPIEATGEPAAAICHEAERRGIDLLVVGSRNLTGPKRLVLGSVSDQVVHHASCDVLIAKTGQDVD